MRFAFPLIFALCASVAAPSGAVLLSEDSLTRMATADVVLLGEVHDNPAHHVTQADLVRRLQPAALVFEMLTDAQASAITPDIRGNAGAVAQAVNWAESGWPDFAMYHPIFLAAPGAAIHGAAVPRDAARAAMQQGLAQAFGDGADRFGLTAPLDDREKAQREALQAEAHCDALPDNLLPGMVDIQRLRDARLAQVALAAFEQTGGPVVIITGNGHARADWGVPHYLRQAAPGITLFALGQSEGARLLPGAFDAVIDAPIVDRPDPCEAFRN